MYDGSPVVSAIICAGFTAILIKACSRFSFGLAAYAAVYYAVSLGSFFCALAGVPEWSGLLLVAAAGAALMVIWMMPSPMKQVRADFWTVALSGVFFWSAVFPAHDPDSMNLHLTWGRQVLERGLFYEAPGWFTQRFAGSGEWLALAGLSSGLDMLQSMLQWGALVVFLRDTAKLFDEKREATNFSLAVLSLPVLLFLIPSQKPQLIGSLMVAWSAIMLVQQKTPIHPGAGLLTALFAVTLKHSFWITALVPALVWTYRWFSGVRNGRISTKSGAVFLIPVPLLAWNLFRWGDPVPPVLTDYLGLHGGFLSDYVQDFNRGFFFPINLLLPNNGGQIGAVLGPVAMCWLAAFFVLKHRRHRFLAAAATIAAVLLSPKEARFFTEFAITGAFIVIPVLSGTRYESFIAAGLKGLAVFAATALFVFCLNRTPTFLEENRAEFVTRFAFDVEAASWAQQIIPKDSVLFSNLNSRFFLPVETIGSDEKFEVKREPGFWSRRLAGGRTLWILTNADPDVESAFSRQFELVKIAETEFQRKTRNPVNTKRERYRIFTARLKRTP